MKTTTPVTDTYSHGFAKIDPVEYFRSIVANLWDTVAAMLCAGSESEIRPVTLLGPYSPSTALCPSFIHAACSFEGARSVLAFIAFTRAAEDAPSSDNP
jgi:hypothetical protein